MAIYKVEKTVYACILFMVTLKRKNIYIYMYAYIACVCGSMCVYTYIHTYILDTGSKPDSTF
jgi:predicted MFS family arabinose efflux permease